MKRNQIEDIGTPLLHFLVFYILEFSRINNCTNNVSYMILDKYGILNYMINSYDVLHTQGKWYVLADIVEILIKKGFYKNGTKVSDVIIEFQGVFD